MGRRALVTGGTGALGKAVTRRLLEAGWGRLVLVSSRTAKEGRNGQSAYAVAKEGVATLAEVTPASAAGRV